MKARPKPTPPATVPTVFVLADWLDESEPVPAGWPPWMWHRLRARQRWTAAKRAAREKG